MLEPAVGKSSRDSDRANCIQSVCVLNNMQFNRLRRLWIDMPAFEGYVAHNVLHLADSRIVQSRFTQEVASDARPEFFITRMEL